MSEQRKVTLDELDALVAEYVMGWRLIDNSGAAGGRFWQGHGGSFADMSKHDVTPFSRSIADAWEVVEKMRAGGGDEFDEFVDDLSCATLSTDGDQRDFLAALSATAAACRICIAALSSLGIEVELTEDVP